MTNEEKSKEIAENQFSWYSEFDDVTSYEECYESAMKAMQWKEQQLIDEACKWLAKNDSYAIPTNLQVDRLKEHLNNVK